MFIHLKLQHIFGTSPVNFIETNGKQVAVLSPTHKITWQWIKLLISSGFLAVLWLQIILSRGKEKLITTLESMLYSTGILAFVILKLIYLRRRYFVVELLNNVVGFEKSLKIGGNQTQYFPPQAIAKVLIQFVQYCFIVATPVLMVTYGLQRWINPCTSALFLYNLIPECVYEKSSPWVNSSLIQLAIQILVSLYLMVDMCGGFIFQVIEMMYLQSCCFKHYIKCLLISLLRCKFKVSHLLRFRQLQIILRRYNLIQQDVMIVALLNMVLLIFVVSLYALIYLGSGDEGISIPQLMFFSCSLLDTFLAIVVCFGAFAGVHKESLRTVAFMRETLLPSLKHNQSHQRRLATRYVMSFRVLKVNIGEVNYVEKFTPIVMLNFCFGQIVNLLLL
ncbi:unnamed protein product [Orchesella dallaii]|uniref:Odorant receptor n=1 Tax=Orchesella dallaii TaxID=48710 RepID=A0ABP1RK23_9HEXA